VDKTIFPAWERAFPRKNRSLMPGNASLQKWWAWEQRSRAFPSTLTPAQAYRYLIFILVHDVVVWRLTRSLCYRLHGHLLYLFILWYCVFFEYVIYFFTIIFAF